MEQNVEKELKKFNLGAAYFGFLWSIVNRCFKKWFLNSLIVGLIAGTLAFCLIGILNVIKPELFGWTILFGCIIVPMFVLIVLFIYIGMKGNRWAWEELQEKDIENFKKTQKNWGIIAGIFLAFNVLCVLVNGSFFYMLINSSDETGTADTTSYISARNCKTVFEILPSALKNTKDDGRWTSNLSNELEKTKNINYAYGSDYSKKITLYINYEDKISSDYIELNAVREIPCSISENNCYISAPTADKEMACRFYFDDNGKVIPSTKTKLYLNNNN